MCVLQAFWTYCISLISQFLCFGVLEHHSGRLFSSPFHSLTYQCLLHLFFLLSAVLAYKFFVIPLGPYAIHSSTHQHLNVFSTAKFSATCYEALRYHLNPQKAQPIFLNVKEIHLWELCHLEPYHTHLG